jgi:hypothetical protein
MFNLITADYHFYTIALLFEAQDIFYMPKMRNEEGGVLIRNSPEEHLALVFEADNLLAAICLKSIYEKVTGFIV